MAKTVPVAPSGTPLGEVFSAAHAAGLTAAATVVPVPMVVSGFESSPVMDGVCGFAWVNIHPGTSPAARYAKKYLGARAAYEGGMQIWVSAYNQSMTRKSAYASAFAAVLMENGITAYAGERMD